MNDRISELESERDRLKAKVASLELLKTNLADWNDSMRLTIFDYLNERANKQDLKLAMTTWRVRPEQNDLWKSKAEKLAEALADIRDIAWDGDGLKAKELGNELSKMAKAALEELGEALRKIVCSAPCEPNHESFNSPGQPCDQTIASNALAEFEEGE